MQIYIFWRVEVFHSYFAQIAVITLYYGVKYLFVLFQGIFHAARVRERTAGKVLDLVGMCPVYFIKSFISFIGNYR